MPVIEVEGLTRSYRSHVGTFRRRIWGGLALLRFFEYEGRRTASLETF